MTPGSTTSRSSLWPVVVIVLLLGWAAVSYVSGGLMHALVAGAGDGDQSLDLIRAALARTGALAPLVYVLAVVVEVVVAPIPGTLLYAPAGALFGGWWGGTLSLAGNVIGATLAAWSVSQLPLSRWLGLADRATLQALITRIRRRGLLVVVLLRINPLTSSDLVSYAAGLAGVSVWRVALGTFIGMAPLCYAQAHASVWLFRVLPGAGLLLVASALAYAVIVIWTLGRIRAK